MISNRGSVVCEVRITQVAARGPKRNCTRK